MYIEIRADVAAHRRPNEREHTAMPRRNSLTRRFLQHLLLISLARSILTVVGRGRAWDEWDERKLVEPAQKRSFQSRFVQTMSFGALFFAGLALSAGAGNGVRSLLDEDAAVPAAEGASGASGPTGATATAAPVRTVLSSEPARTVVAHEQVAPSRPVVSAAPNVGARTAVVSSRSTGAAQLRASTRPSAAGTKRTAVSKTHVARPGQARTRPQHKAPGKHQVAPKAPALDPEVASFSAATVWLNRAAPDPTPPAARLQIAFARQLVASSRKAHVDWALVLAMLRAEGNNGRSPAGSQALRLLSFRLSSLNAHSTPWAAALAYSSDTAVADRVVALRHYYRAVGLASLVHGLLSQRADLQDRVLHDSRIVMYP
ncbi:MAG TPA: hypothetical protein VF752_06410, partial [Thermoleophilaceae bacterium]